jgi:hypothetical protein
MPRPWSEERKKRLTAMRAAGRSADDIAKALDLRREQVAARLELMAMWERNQASFAKAMEKRESLRDARARKALATMKRAIAQGTHRSDAMLQANRDGATWREIGEQFGITAQAAGTAAHSRHRGGAGLNAAKKSNKKSDHKARKASPRKSRARVSRR